MLNGKKFPENVTALRMLVEELLRPLFERNKLNSMDDLQEALNQASQKNRTAKLWVSCLIEPILIVMRYVRAERESDWPMHLACVEEMIPLFFTAGHLHYARYALYYVRSMNDMPDDVSQAFMKGQHTMHHNAGIFIVIWSDMAIESTFMRYGHGTGGIIGITLKPETLKTWTYSLHTCNDIVQSLDVMLEQRRSTFPNPA